MLVALACDRRLDGPSGSERMNVQMHSIVVPHAALAFENHTHSRVHVSMSLGACAAVVMEKSAHVVLECRIYTVYFARPVHQEQCPARRNAQPLPPSLHYLLLRSLNCLDIVRTSAAQ